MTQVEIEGDTFDRHHQGNYLLRRDREHIKRVISAKRQLFDRDAQVRVSA